MIHEPWELDVDGATERTDLDRSVSGQRGDDPGVWQRVYAAISRTDERSRRRAFFLGAWFGVYAVAVTALSIVRHEPASPAPIIGVFVMVHSLGELSGRRHHVAISRVLAAAMIIAYVPLFFGTWG